MQKVGCWGPSTSMAAYNSSSRCTHVHAVKHSHSQTKQNKSSKRLHLGLSQTSLQELAWKFWQERAAVVYPWLNTWPPLSGEGHPLWLNTYLGKVILFDWTHSFWRAKLRMARNGTLVYPTRSAKSTIVTNGWQMSQPGRLHIQQTSLWNQRKWRLWSQNLFFHRQCACALRHQKPGMKNHARSRAAPTHRLQDSVPILPRATKNSNCHMCVSFKKHPLNVSRSSSLFGILKLKPMCPVRLS